MEVKNMRDGDRARIHCTIADAHPTGDHVRVFLAGHHVYVDTSDLELVTPEFRVGDWVELSNPAQGQPVVAAQILAIHGDHLWVEWAEGRFATWWVEIVRRVSVCGKELEARGL